ncbi:hypothetical protein K7G98_33735, partial [Saccharothrix sp. MB29]|nr:hypothetical protein [Saccharothrix sp. MB29]
MRCISCNVATDEASAQLWRGERRAVVLRTGGELFFAVAYVLGTLLVLRDGGAERSRAALTIDSARRPSSSGGTAASGSSNSSGLS